VSMHSLSTLEDAESALRLLLECLVLSFRFRPSQSTVTFVCDYPQKTPGSSREFAAFIFHDVGEFSRQFGNLERLRAFREAYELRDESGGVVVQSIRLENAPSGKNRVVFWLGVNFGGISFEYAWVEGFTRASIVQEVNGAFLYRDLRTGEEFDFLEPFAGLLNGQSRSGKQRPRRP
jgi:hypothetical protein